MLLTRGNLHMAGHHRFSIGKLLFPERDELGEQGLGAIGHGRMLE